MRLILCCSILILSAESFAGPTCDIAAMKQALNQGEQLVHARPGTAGETEVLERVNGELKINYKSSNDAVSTRSNVQLTTREVDNLAKDARVYRVEKNTSTVSFDSLKSDSRLDMSVVKRIRAGDQVEVKLASQSEYNAMIKDSLKKELQAAKAEIRKAIPEDWRSGDSQFRQAWEAKRKQIMANEIRSVSPVKLTVTRVSDDGHVFFAFPRYDTSGKLIDYVEKGYAANAIDYFKWTGNLRSSSQL